MWETQVKRSLPPNHLWFSENIKIDQCIWSRNYFLWTKITTFHSDLKSDVHSTLDVFLLLLLFLTQNQNPTILRAIFVLTISEPKWTNLRLLAFHYFSQRNLYAINQFDFPLWYMGVIRRLKKNCVLNSLLVIKITQTLNQSCNCMSFEIQKLG